MFVLKIYCSFYFKIKCLQLEIAFICYKREVFVFVFENELYLYCLPRQGNLPVVAARARSNFLNESPFE